MMTSHRPSVLVVESEEHYFLCSSTLELLGPMADVHFLLGRGLTPGNRATKNWWVMFPERSDGSGVTLARHRTIFLRALLSSLRFDLIWIQTGPEFGPLLKVLLFWLLCRSRSRRVIVAVHGLTPYGGRIGGVAGRIRAAALRNVGGVVLESEALRRAYRTGTEPGCGGPRTAVARVRYARPRDARSDPAPRRNPTDRVRVGLVGGVTRKRRDFEMLEAALRRMPQESRGRIEVATLGNCTKQRCHDIMDRLAELVPVDVVPRHLTEEEFLARGSACHVLLAPLTERLRYGSRQGSGAFGDAIRLGRRLIVPAAADPLDEYAGLTLPYRDVDEFAERLTSAGLVPEMPDPDVLDRLTAAAVRADLVADLGLEDVLGTIPRPTP